MSDWKFDVEDVGEDDDENGDEDASQMYPMDEPLEPGTPSAENILFVVLGALTMVFVFLRLTGLA
ncbi:hypothetical protein SAMN05421858_0357 [Haladaptatus litoreus]|uniref:DUF7312 domain-containing protein n=1 Tax=Haladaptatus litoreus TaxID=553468 RepID=A0A1N6VH43_9EURY|nr:hypothetical protein [Haladaptatus litoreus]SIQ77201.1 hypothetical protein SAMN05421858_0357 [Haladaptatus litoreus]